MPSLYRTIATPTRFIHPPQASNNPGRMPQRPIPHQNSAAVLFHTNNFPTIYTGRGGFGDGEDVPSGTGINPDTGRPRILASAPGDVNPVDAAAQPGVAGFWAGLSTDGKIAAGVGGLAAVGFAIHLWMNRKKKR